LLIFTQPSLAGHLASFITNLPDALKSVASFSGLDFTSFIAICSFKLAGTVPPVLLLPSIIISRDSLEPPEVED